MRLERRLLGYLAVVMAALSVLLLVASSIAILETASRTDRTETTRSVELVREVLASERAEMAGNAVDWATWDATYDFVAGANPGYVAENLPDETLANLDVDVLAVYDGLGRAVYVTTAGGAPSAGNVPGEFGDLLYRWPKLNAASGIARYVSGFVPLPGGRILLATSAPIMPTAGSGLPNGSLVMGRILDEARMRRVSRIAQHSLSLRAPSPAASGAKSGTAEDEVETAVKDFSTMEGFYTLDDLNGDAIGSIVVQNDRTAWGGGVLALTLLSCGLVVLQLGTTYVLRHGIRSIVLKRLLLLDVQVDRIRKSGEVEAIDIGGTDELASLGQNVGQMITALDVSRKQLAHARDELEVRVRERTTELTHTVVALEEQVTARRDAEDRQAVSDERYRVLIDNLADTVFVLDTAGLVSFMSSGIEWSFGYLPEDLIGKPLGQILTLPSAHALEHQLERGLASDGTVLGLQGVASDGRLLDVEVVLTPLDADLGTTQGIIRDVTARRRYEDELLHMASHDFLTGLANRRRFEEELERALASARRHGTEGAVLWLDLDNFKDVNDTLGHHAGDDLLMDISQTLKSAIRAESMLARLGGDEFAVLLPIADEEEAARAAERLLGEIARVSVYLNGRLMHASCSMGIVMFPRDGLDVDDLLARADMAMYRAKQLGRARCVFFTNDDEWRDEIEDRRAWAEQIEMAVSENGLVVFAQPIVGLHDGSVGCYELLVRMLDVDNRYIPPDRFIAVAERTGLVVDIDLWVLREAVRLLGEYAADDLHLNVNVSPRTLADSRFVAEVSRLVASSGIEAERLGIEITETAIIVDVAGVKDVLKELKRIGCRVLLDDFGSGFTSFLHLKQLPVDTLKIDGSFVQRLHENTNDQHLVRAMVEMARGLGMGTTAEFVETADTVAMLRDFGVETIQGYHVGRPGLAREVIDGVHAERDARAGATVVPGSVAAG